MGIFSAIGGILGGPLGGAIGGIGDGILGHASERSDARRYNRAEMDKFLRLREAAERGGFHPLEALRAGYSVDTQHAPRLLSSLARSNSFDALENELTGQAAKDRRRQQVRDEILERELEIMKTEVARRQINNPTVLSNRPARIGVSGNQSDEGISSSVTSVSALPVEDDDRFMSDPNRADAGNLQERFGESEIIEMPLFLVNVLSDLAYNERVTRAARRLNISRAEVHRRVEAGGREAAREILGVVLKPEPDREGTGNSPFSRRFWNLPPKAELRGPRYQ